MEQPDNQRRPPVLVVEVFSPGSIGGTPCVVVEHLQAGFDWDSGKVMLRTQQPVTVLTPEQVADIQTSARQGQSWHAYQAHKAMQEKLLEAKAQRDGAYAILKDLVALVNGPDSSSETPIDAMKLVRIVDRAAEVVNG
ncbi:hypothetical protein Dolphis_65 [Pseudomonas phage Dolphis]|nr:hypothetical protein Dolphis_65 [Pseudomonas phage Dolphis]